MTMLKRIKREARAIGDALAVVAVIVSLVAVVVGVPLAMLFAVVRVIRFAWSGT